MTSDEKASRDEIEWLERLIAGSGAMVTIKRVNMKPEAYYILYTQFELDPPVKFRLELKLAD